MKHEPARFAHIEGFTDVCYTEGTNKFVTAGADGDIRIWPTNDKEDVQHTCVGEWVLCVRNKGENFYVSTNNNDVQILSLPNGERMGILDRFVAPINHIAFAKNANVVALACENMEVKVRDLDKSLDESIVFKTEGPCLSVALSPKAEYLACSSGDKKLRIFNTSNKELVHEIECFPKVNSFFNTELLCRIDFEPKNGKHLAYPLDKTIVLLNTFDWTEMCKLSCEEVEAPFTTLQYSPGGSHLAAATTKGEFVVWDLESRQYEISQNDQKMSICTLMWNPKDNGEIVYTDREGNLSIISNCKLNEEESNAPQEIFEEPENVEMNNLEENPDDEDNENVISLEKLKKDYTINESDEELAKLDTRSRSPTPRPRTPETPLQPAFMPSSTPDHLDPRYLCWNHIGIIRSYGLQDENSINKSIEVEFHDTTFHNQIMFTNFKNYTMASISSTALILANDNELKVIPLKQSSNEWDIKMNENEEILCVAVSENLIVLALNNYFIRVFSIYGTQLAVFIINGPIVCIAAYKNRILLAHHLGSARKDDQCINIKEVTFEGLKFNSKDLGSALTPESSLFWLGFSDLGTPAMQDFNGILSLYPLCSNVWVPFCDTTRQGSKFDGFFPTAVIESNQTVRGIKCRDSKYPTFIPRPIMCELTLEPMFASVSNDKCEMEANLFTWSTLNVNNVGKKYKETALKTFALACRNDFDQRAIELMEILSNPQLIQLAVKYAGKLEKHRLVENLLDLVERLQSTDNVVINNFETNSTITPEPKKVFSQRKISLSAYKTPKNKSQPLDESKENTISVENTPTMCEINSQDVSVNDEPSNPFAKTLKKSKLAYNPISLTDSRAGINLEMNETKEKRKQPDSEMEQQREKQRKLDKFFTK